MTVAYFLFNNMKFFNRFLAFVFFLISVDAAAFTIETESMALSGSYAGTISTPFSGIALYANGDKGTATHAFPDGNGTYEISLRGASNNANAAGVSLYVNNEKIKAFSFYGTAPATLQATVKITNLNPSSNNIELKLETDNGSSDTFLDQISFEFQGAIVIKDPPVLPEAGAYYTGEYRNMLQEAGYTGVQINQKLQSLWDQLFYGDETTQRVYYPVGTDEAYILDTGNDDIRSEGMSYGMMICVQMDKQEEFNRLWKWAKTKMQFQTGAQKGYFSWQIKQDGTTRSSQAAPDGDEYFIMALMFASGRWGNEEGIFDYWKEANEILANTMSKGVLINSSTTNMFDEKEKQVVFVPYASSAKHTDPSYHLPAFYQLWSYWADTKRWFWREVANKSRAMFHLFAHAQTGLMPDYANFDGTPTGGSHADFRYDAWRAIMNVAMDFAWFKADETQTDLVNRLQNFFASKGVDSYGSEFSLSGNQLNSDHSPGLVACNATASLASNQSIAWDFIENFYNTSLTTGKYRYYDGLLYFMNYLHLSGNFRIYKPQEVLDTPLDENYTYNNGYLIMDDFESREIDKEYFMRRTESSTASAKVTTNPLIPTEHALQILPGNYDEYFTLQFKLPEGRTLKSDFTQFEFDIFYDLTGDNQKQDLKVDFDIIQSTPFFKISTGEKTNHGKWEHVSVPLTGVQSENIFKLYICVRTRSANYYIDNLKLKMNYSPPTSVSEQTDTKINFYVQEDVLRLKNQVESINIYDVNGQMELQSTNSAYINIKDLVSGVYIMQIQSSGKVYTMKFVKNF